MNEGRAVVIEPREEPLNSRVARQASDDAGRPDDSTLRSRLSTWEYVSFSLAHAATSGLLRLLSLRGLYRFGRAFGTVEWLINFKRRRRFAEALRPMLNESSSADRRRHIREHFMQTRCDKLFYLAFDRISREVADTRLTIVNRPLLDGALASGRGVYMALSHHGPLHVVAMLMALAGYKTAGVRDRREGALRRYIQDRFDRRYPEFRRMRVLFADGFPREIFRCLAEGFVLGSAMDVARLRDERQRYREVTIFGRTQRFLTGPLRIAIRCRATVLQAFIVPEADFHYRLDIVETLFDPGIDADRDEEAVVERAMDRYAANVETWLRRYPSLLTRV